MLEAKRQALLHCRGLRSRLEEPGLHSPFSIIEWTDLFWFLSGFCVLCLDEHIAAASSDEGNSSSL